MSVTVTRVEEKSKARRLHWLSDGRYVLENRRTGPGQQPWSLWQPGRGATAKFVRDGSSLGQLLKWAAKHP